MMIADTNETAYRADAMQTAHIAFSHWQREPASPSFGCFDRPYWGWKKKDLADTTLQAAVTLVLKLAEAGGNTRSLPSLLAGYVTFLERIQHSDGSFDQIYPYERAPGVVHDILTPMIRVFQSGYLDTPDRDRLEAIIHRSVAYALTADEKHGDIANHFAHYAWEFIHYGRTFNHDQAQARGFDYLTRTLALLQNREGWFKEYDGADAGYQTRLIAFLARIADVAGNNELWSIVENSARFVETFLMPDGSIHPMLGVRSTSLIYPSAFERLAHRDESFRALADRIHSGWAIGATPRPSLIDFENGLRLADDAFEADEYRRRRQPIAQTDHQPTTQTPALRVDLPEAGLHRRTTVFPNGRRNVYVATRLGGPVVIFDETEGDVRLTFEDSGYLLVLADGTRWISRRAGAGQIVQVDDEALEINVQFGRSLHEDMKPLQLILLRILNLTVLRVQWIGDVFKKLVVRRLISGRDTMPLICNRRVTISAGTVTIRDRFSLAPSLSDRLRNAKLYSCRRTIANHMASSRYFQPKELSGEQPWLVEVSLDALNGKDIERTIRL